MFRPIREEESKRSASSEEEARGQKNTPGQPNEDESTLSEYEKVVRELLKDPRFVEKKPKEGQARVILNPHPALVEQVRKMQEKK